MTATTSTKSNTSRTDLHRDEKDHNQSETSSQIQSSSPSSDGKPEPPPYSVFSKNKKVFIVSLATAAQMSSFLTINVYFPAVPIMAEQLNCSISDLNLTITIYMIFQGISPVISGSLSDRYGRRPVYVISLLVYMISNIALAKQTTLAGILVLRCVQSIGCSALPCLAGAVVSDMIAPAERGTYIGITGLPQVVGPSLGPIIGGALVQSFGWPSIFWLLAIFAGVQLIMVISILPETCRRIVKDGSRLPPPMNRSLWQAIRQNKYEESATEADVADTPDLNLLRCFLDPLRIFCSPPALTLALYSGLFYGGMYTITASLSPETQKLFGLTPIQQGLMFLPYGIGALFAAVGGAFFIDKNFARYAKKRNGEKLEDAHNDPAFPYERARLDFAIPMYLLGSATIVGYGWVLARSPSIPGLCALTFFLGFATATASNAIFILMCDTHRGRQAAASASLSFTKCPLGAGAVAAVNPMISALGLGPSFTLIGGLEAFFIFLLFWDARYGTWWRNRKSNMQSFSSQSVVAP